MCVELAVNRAERSVAQRPEQQGVPHSPWMGRIDLVAADGIGAGESEVLRVRSAFDGPNFYFDEFCACLFRVLCVSCSGLRCN